MRIEVELFEFPDEEIKEEYIARFGEPKPEIPSEMLEIMSMIDEMIYARRIGRHDLFQEISEKVCDYRQTWLKEIEKENWGWKGWPPTTMQSSRKSRQK